MKGWMGLISFGIAEETGVPVAGSSVIDLLGNVAECFTMLQCCWAVGNGLWSVLSWGAADNIYRPLNPQTKLAEHSKQFESNKQTVLNYSSRFSDDDEWKWRLRMDKCLVRRSSWSSNVCAGFPKSSIASFSVYHFKFRSLLLFLFWISLNLSQYLRRKLKLYIFSGSSTATASGDGDGEWMRDFDSLERSAQHFGLHDPSSSCFDCRLSGAGSTVSIEPSAGRLSLGFHSYPWLLRPSDVDAVSSTITHRLESAKVSPLHSLFLRLRYNPQVSRAAFVSSDQVLEHFLPISKCFI